MQFSKFLVMLVFAVLAFAALARAEPVPEPDVKKAYGYQHKRPVPDNSPTVGTLCARCPVLGTRGTN
jgi:hypothetical protein